MLGITRNTAAGYVKVIYRKLNVSSRAEATLEATRQGLVGLDAGMSRSAPPCAPPRSSATASRVVAQLGEQVHRYPHRAGSRCSP